MSLTDLFVLINFASKPKGGTMKLTKQDWVRKGFEMLSTEGYHAIMIDYLCAKFKITKGSFYHYFDGIDEYVRLLVKEWEKQVMMRLETVMAGATTPEEKINRMVEFSFGFSGRLELSLRAWALHNKLVKNLLIKMELRRIEIMSGLFEELGLTKKKAREMAELAHASWIGIQTCNIEGVVNREQCIQLINDLMQLMIRRQVSEKA